jgi:hypothetical protein
MKRNLLIALHGLAPVVANAAPGRADVTQWDVNGV